jgi:hypothetical protein
MGKTSYSRNPTGTKGTFPFNSVARTSARDLRVHYKNTY